MIRNKYIVDNKLIRGSRPLFRDVLKLKKEGVNQIICVSSKHHYVEKLACKLSHINFVQYKRSILDNTFLGFDDYKNITNNIKNNDGKTFLHCGLGLHRTAECVAAYNIFEKGKPFIKTLTEDIFDKNYFGIKYRPQNTEIKNGDNLITRLKKRHSKKVYNALAQSLSNFINIFKEDAKKLQNQK